MKREKASQHSLSVHYTESILPVPDANVKKNCTRSDRCFLYVPITQIGNSCKKQNTGKPQLAGAMSLVYQTTRKNLIKNSAEMA